MNQFAAVLEDWATELPINGSFLDAVDDTAHRAVAKIIVAFPEMTEDEVRLALITALEAEDE